MTPKENIKNMIDEIQNNLYYLQNTLDEYTELLYESPTNMTEWKETVIKLLPDNIDLGLAMKIEETLNTLIKG